MGKSSEIARARILMAALSMKMVGVGSQYASAFVDSEGKALDESKTYKIHLPPSVPAKNFWSFVVYDTQTRSELQTDEQFPSIGSQKEGSSDHLKEREQVLVSGIMIAQSGSDSWSELLSSLRALIDAQWLI
jgi:hypothetical protein